MAQHQHAFVWDAASVQRFETLVYAPAVFEQGGCHVVNLSVRGKYDVAREMTLSGKQGMHIEHRIVNEPGRLLRTLRKYDVPPDALVDDADKPIPAHCLAVYSTLDTRSALGGMKALSDEWQALMYEMARNPAGRAGGGFDPRRRLISAISRSTHSRVFCQIDIDEKDEALLRAVARLLREWGTAPVFTIETRGGWHVVLRYKDVPGKHQRDLRNVTEVVPGGKRADGKALVEFLDSTALIPVPGTRQGGFAVRFVDLPADL